MRRRWQLHGHAGQLLNDKVGRVNRAGEEVAHYVYRVAMCQRGMDGWGVKINRSPDHDRAEFGVLQTCGSPWHCPTCGPRIAARQVKQINLGFKAWFDRSAPLIGPEELDLESRAPFVPVYLSRALYFLTFTNQHDRERAGQGRCKAALGQQAALLSSFKSNRFFRRLMQLGGAPGSIRGLETSYGELNGWHHHTHDILFACSGLLVCDRGGQPVRWLSPLFRLRREWARALIRADMAGLNPGDIGVAKFRKLRHLLQRCFDARDGSFAAEYLVKLGKEPESARGRWGAASELAKSHLKGGRGDGGAPQRCEHASPWALLNDSMDGDTRSGELWREFALAFHGRAKLYWSPGLKGLLGVPHVDDIEFARAPDARCSEPVIELSPIQWRKVLAHNARFDVLRQAAINGREGVLSLLAWLDRIPAKESGEFSDTERWLPPPGFVEYHVGDGRKRKYWG